MVTEYVRIQQYSVCPICRNKPRTMLAVDPAVIIAGLASAVASLAGAYNYLQNRQRKVQDERIGSLERTVRDLEAENKRYQALMVVAAGSPEGVEQMRQELARMLRGD